MSLELPKNASSAANVEVLTAAESAIAEFIQLQLRRKEMSKPSNYGKRSAAPYYNHKIGAALKKTLDDMFDNGNHQKIYYYLDFPNLSKQTLRLRIKQGINYIVDNMDTTDHKYAKMRSALKLTCKYAQGILLSFDPNLYNENAAEAHRENTFTPRDFIIESGEHEGELVTWESQLQDWLENPQGKEQTFVKDGLMLNADEIQQLEVMLAGIPTITYRIKPHIVKVVRVD